MITDSNLFLSLSLRCFKLYVFVPLLGKWPQGEQDVFSASRSKAITAMDPLFLAVSILSASCLCDPSGNTHMML